MPAAPSTIRSAIGTAITSNVSGLRAVTSLGDQTNPPVAVVGFPALRRNTMSDGSFGYELTVRVFVQSGSANAAGDAIDTYMTIGGAKDVWTAIEAADITGGYAEVQSAEPADEDGMVFIDFQVEVIV